MAAFSFNKINRQLLAVFLTCAICWLFSFLAICVFKGYAYSLFIFMPMALGATSTVIYGYKNKVTKKQLRSTAYLTLLVYTVGLLAFAFEGVICIAMAAPIGFLFTWTGYLLGYQIIENQIIRNKQVAVILILLSVPGVMGFENAVKTTDDIRFVTTSMEINATPETVWENVIAFPELDNPTEFIFKTGIAYPINAVIDGNGVGAVRHCNFSTGSFVEPITVWDEPRLLKFSVSDQPEPMKELSPYNIHPNHLHGYFVSQQGQFKLTLLPNGHTLLEGTTWYYNRIKPTIYWVIWSDYIIHKIHERVLRHIKVQAEKTIQS